MAWGYAKRRNIKGYRVSDISVKDEFYTYVGYCKALKQHDF